MKTSVESKFNAYYEQQCKHLKLKGLHVPISFAIPTYPPLLQVDELRNYAAGNDKIFFS